MRGGNRIWAVARVATNAVVAKDDELAPYVLLSTSFVTAPAAPSRSSRRSAWLQ
ncbi:hypothetical protein [Cupriavidus basilensis]|uniref:hypothetical protein n=1 Tax=Cupriavidus basilensis TaxID=68895 RepID=UPI00157B775B|nr:DUF945 domain-containing protein [Cupriavidus basilensis]